ncbi:MAG: amino acid ABC transporter substrate-binding protein [Candidatus Thorarchaeota archaeon]|nr:amino acid ABC transporter substrate-binding protein [Candidatus Thorarchaeota archaeon]
MQENTKLVAVVMIGLVIGVGIGYVIPSAPPVQQDLLNTIQSNDEIIVGTSSGWPPFEMLNETTGELYGFDIDLVEYVADYLGVNVTWQDMDFDALVGSCQSGSIHMIAAATFATDARTDVLAASQWYMKSDQVLATLANFTLDEISNITELEGYTVGAQTGTVEAEQLEEYASAGYNIDVETYPRPDTLFQDLGDGIIDAVYVDAPVLQLYSDIYSLKTIYKESSPPYVFFIQKGNPELLEEIDDAIIAAHVDGTIDELIEKWFG